MKEITYSLEKLAELTNSKLCKSFEVKISGIADIESAEKQDLTFLSNPRYEKLLNSSSAGVIILSPNSERPEQKNYLLNENPSQAFQVVLELFAKNLGPTTGFEGIHPSAIIHSSAIIGKDVTIGPNVVIDEDVTIGNQSSIAALSFVGKGSHIGDNVTIYQNVTIREYSILGDRVSIQPGAVIGSCGFGYLTDKTGQHTKLQQLGNVILEDDVEVGANCTIDRARFKSTIIGKGSKVDNLVQIAHAAKTGKHCLIVAQSGISGSTHLGNHVVLGGQTGIVGHIKIGDFVQTAAKSGITKNLLKPGGYRGHPAIPIDQFQRKEVQLRNIDKLIKRIEVLEKLMEAK